METKTLGIALLALVIGLGGGFLIAKEKAPKPQGMSHAMSGMMAGLEGKTGEEFDRTFIEEMTVHHEGAVAMAEAALQHATRAEIRQLAEEIIAAQTREIDMMHNWLHDWYDAH